MLLLKFLEIIDKSPIGRFIDAKRKILESTDPERIYVENIRSFYNMPRSMAKFFCEMAVKERLFNKKVGIYCPDCGRMIISVDSKNDLPDTVTCETCEGLEKIKHSFSNKEFKTDEFYQLVNN